MNLNKFARTLALGAGLAVASGVSAEDLTVARGTSVDITMDTSYDTVSVSGVLNIGKGVRLTVKTLNLGPNKGDAAVVNVLGSDEDGALTVTDVINVGGETGGRGKIVALSPDADHIKDDISIVSFPKAVVAATAEPDEDGFIEFLQLGPGSVHFKDFENNSASTVRIRVKNGCLGGGGNHEQYWGSAFFLRGAFQIESDEDGDIYLGAWFTERKLLSPGASVKVLAKGRGVYFCRSNNSDSANNRQGLHLDTGVTFDSVGEFKLIDSCRVFACGDDVLPYGAGSSAAVHVPDGLFIDIAETVQHLNSFSGPIQSGLGAALRGQEGGRVIFGADDVDGAVAGGISDVLSVCKVGEGILQMEEPVALGDLAVSNGTLRIAADLALRSLYVAESATVEIDGVTVEPSQGVADIRGKLILKNGGRLLSFCDTAEDVRVPGYANGGNWEKRGEGTCILEDPVQMPTNIRVTAGCLTFSATGYDCPLYRWNVTAWHSSGYMDKGNGAADDRFYLGELAFVSADGSRQGKGIAAAATGTKPSELASGTAVFEAGTELIAEGGKGTIEGLFDSKAWPRVGVVTPSTKDAGGVTLYVKLPDGAAPITAMNFTGCWGGFPKAWTLSGSRDNGETWTVLHSATDFAPATDDSERWMGAAANGYDEPLPQAFRLSTADASWVRPGVANMPSAIQLEVAAGAVADFTNVTDGQVVDAITLDLTTGGGTVSNAVIAANGTFYLKNLPTGKKLHDVVAAMVFAGTKGTDNFNSWAVYLDGVLQDSARFSPRYSKDGTLSFGKNGFTIRIR